MEYLVLSFLAGILTVLSPCVFAILPVVLGSSLKNTDWKKPLRIIAALSLSVILFTLLLKSSTLLIDIPRQFWAYFSGGVIFVFGVFMLFPNLWDKISVKLGLGQKSQEALQKLSSKEGTMSDLLIGLALGPVFSSCSPTYSLIIATVLPASFAVGMLNLLVYVLGMSLFLLLIALLGQKLISNLKWAVNPEGWFKKSLGILLIVIGVLIITGTDKVIEAKLLEMGLFNATSIELNLLK